MTFNPQIFSFSSNIPFRTDYPGNDQPTMQTNNANTASAIAVDHVAVNMTGAGWHQKITFNGNYTILPNTSTFPTGFVSLEYSRVASANTNVPVLAWRNSQSDFILNTINAYGVFTLNASGVAPIVQTLLNQFNVVSATYIGKAAGQNQIQIVLNAALFTTGVLPGVILNCSDGTSPSWSFSGSTLTITGPVNNTNVTFMLLQV